MSSNIQTKSNVCSRAMLAAAFVSAASSGTENWYCYKNGKQTLNQAIGGTIKSVTKASLISGAVILAAKSTSDRPVMTLLTTLSAVTAGLYLLDELNGEQDDNK